MKDICLGPLTRAYYIVAVPVGVRNDSVLMCADACATFSQERHDNSLRTINGFCRQRTVQQLADEIAQAKK